LGGAARTGSSGPGITAPFNARRKDHRRGTCTVSSRARRSWPWRRSRAAWPASVLTLLAGWAALIW